MSENRRLLRIMSSFLAPHPACANRPLRRGCAILGILLLAAAVPTEASAKDGALALDTSLIIDGMASTSADGSESGTTATIDIKLLIDGAPLGLAGLTGMANLAIYSGDGLSGPLGDL